MKLTKALVVASVLVFASLTGCIGTEVDEPAEEVDEPAEEVDEPAEEVDEPAEEHSQQVTAQTTCTPIPGVTPVTPGLTCNYRGLWVFNHYKTEYSNCLLFNCSSGTWHYYRANINNDGCASVEDLYCS
jgi:hypothetical protein